ncbi:pilus assembly protein [Lysobacter korlensis]|uniref:Pilus assembly protein n=1 Tax=Lysobacter korlensis TaxID=553636 RepID=A0ABV6RKW5_9GAMM
MTRYAPCHPRRQRGQALTELAVAAAVLVPLFLLVPIVAKYGHIKQMAQQSARNAAWEATVSRNYRMASAAAIQAKMLDRSFARADAAIVSTTSGRRQGRFDDPMLDTFSGRALLERDNARVTRWRERTAPGAASRAVSRIPGLVPGAFPPNRNGYVTAEVELRIRELQTSDGGRARYLAPMDQLNLVLRSRQSLVADAWNASGPRSGRRSVTSQVRTLAPTTLLAPLSRVFDTVGSLPLPIIGKLDDLDIGTVEPDIVPHDRLRRYPVRAR